MKGKVLCGMVAALMVFGATAASAATYSTTTAYSGTDKIEVTTVVSDIQAGQSVTYLAYNDADVLTSPEEMTDALVYVDQYDAEADGSHTFNYVTSEGNLAITGLKFGGASPDAMALPNKTVYLWVDGANTGKVFTLPTELDGNLIMDYAVDLSGRNVTSVTLNDVQLSADKYVVTATGIKVYGNNYGATNTLKVTTESAGEMSIVIFKAGRYVNDDDNEEMMVLANVVCEESMEYGIIFDGESFKALGKGANGDFAIQLIDENNAGAFVGTDPLYVQGYVDGLTTEEVEVPLISDGI